MKIESKVLTNLVWRSLRELMDGDLSNQEVEPEVIEEAQFLLALLELTARKAPAAVIEIAYAAKS